MTEESPKSFARKMRIHHSNSFNLSSSPQFHPHQQIQPVDTKQCLTPHVAAVAATAEDVGVVIVGIPVVGDGVVAEEMRTYPSGPLTVAVVEATLITIAAVVATEEMTPAVVVISAVAVIEATSAAAVIEAVGIEVGVTEVVAAIVDEVDSVRKSSSEFHFYAISELCLIKNTYSEGQPVPVPDTNVQKLEDSLAENLAVARPKTSNGAKYPTRPGYGTLGKPVTLYANYLALTSVGKQLFRYHVEIKDGLGKADKAPVGKKARQIVRLLLEEHFASNKKAIATDYRSTLIACFELLKEEKTFDVRYKDEGQDDYSESPRVYKVTCQPTGKISPSALMDYLTSSNTGDLLDSKPEIVAALNIIMGHRPKTHKEIVSVGANKHFSLEQGGIERADLGNGLEVLRGFFISVRAATARVLLNVQVKYMACFKEGPLTMVIADWQPEARFRNLYRLEVFLKRMRVKPTHIDRKSKSGKPRPAPFKTISGLAAKHDGKDLAHPPMVKNHGAGPRDVLFFLSNTDTPGGGPPPGPSGSESASV